MNHKKKGNLVHLSSYVSKDELQQIKRKARHEVVSTSGLVRKLVAIEIKK